MSRPPTNFCDNTGATYLCCNPVLHSRMKHISLDYHFVRKQVQPGKLHMLHVSTQDQLADLLTKPLPTSKFEDMRFKIKVTNGNFILRGVIQLKEYQIIWIKLNLVVLFVKVFYYKKYKSIFLFSKLKN